MNIPIISARNLTKSYRLYANPTDRLKEAIWPFKPRHTLFHALSDVSFDISKGEHFGIIGINGAGKSTLLQLLTGVLSPTSGSVQVHGKIAALLELGAGFNPELSGRENVTFQLALANVPEDKIEEKIEEIESFADIGVFFNQPVKIYSSGMFVRVAFAQAIAVNPDIFIVDEALSVGDARFQKKCNDRVEQLRQDGVTMLMVTHDIYTSKRLSSKMMLLHQGQVRALGEPETVVSKYFQMLFPDNASKSESSSSKNNSSESDTAHGNGKTLASTDQTDDYIYTIAPVPKDKRWGLGGASLLELRIKGLTAPNRLTCGSKKIQVECDYSFDTQRLLNLAAEYGVIPNLLIALRLDNQAGQPLTDFASSLLGGGVLDFDLATEEKVTFRFTLELPELIRGEYFFTPGMALGTQQHLIPIFSYDNLVMITVEPERQILGLFRMPYSIERTA